MRLKSEGLKLIVEWPGHYYDGAIVAQFHATLGRYEDEAKLCARLAIGYNLLADTETLDEAPAAGNPRVLSGRKNPSAAAKRSTPKARK